MIIPATQKHHSYILSSWKSTYRKGWDGRANPLLPMPNQEYQSGQSELIIRLLDKSTTLVWEEDGLTLAWACFAGPRILHYCYTRDLFRGDGLQMKLWAGQIDYSKPYYVTHYRPGMQKHNLLAKSIYNPYLLYGDY